MCDYMAPAPAIGAPDDGWPRFAWINCLMRGCSRSPAPYRGAGNHRYIFILCKGAVPSKKTDQSARTRRDDLSQDLCVSMYLAFRGPIGPRGRYGPRGPMRSMWHVYKVVSECAPPAFADRAVTRHLGRDHL